VVVHYGVVGHPLGWAWQVVHELDGMVDAVELTGAGGVAWSSHRLRDREAARLGGRCGGKEKGGKTMVEWSPLFVMELTAIAETLGNSSSGNRASSSMVSTL
jgi:hypothetical protein